MTKPAAYRVEYTTHTGYVDTSYQEDSLTDADKAAGWRETPLYEDPTGEIGRLREENERLKADLAQTVRIGHAALKGEDRTDGEEFSRYRQNILDRR